MNQNNKTKNKQQNKKKAQRWFTSSLMIAGEYLLFLLYFFKETGICQGPAVDGRVT